MNPEVKKLWVAALRSGEYKQTTKKLRNKRNEFCCLGVLCNLHAQAHPEIAAKQTNPLLYMRNAEVLPLTVSKWAGLTDVLGDSIRINDENHNLAYWNDNGVKFQTIASAIEEQL